MTSFISPCWHLVEVCFFLSGSWLRLMQTASFVPYLNHMDSINATFLLSVSFLGTQDIFGCSPVVFQRCGELLEVLAVPFCLDLRCSLYSVFILQNMLGSENGFRNCLRPCSEKRRRIPLFSDFSNTPRIVFFPPWTQSIRWGQGLRPPLIASPDQRIFIQSRTGQCGFSCSFQTNYLQYKLYALKPLKLKMSFCFFKKNAKSFKSLVFLISLFP